MRFTIPIIIVVLLIGGLMVWNSQKQASQDTVVPIPTTVDTGAPEESTGQMEGSITYQGQQIAGITSPYLAFTKIDYDKAVASGKIVFLDFYANWCPICRAEAPEIQAGFDELTTDGVVGFRVNYKDDETDDDEQALAEKFQIPYQHTKVILVNGQEVKRSGDSWDKETFLNEINELL